MDAEATSGEAKEGATMKAIRHESACRAALAQGAVGIECPHGRDVCPTCDVCTCEQRNGDWIQTFSGGQFWPMDAAANEVHIADIAHHLAMVCRFGGAVREFYSVAEHCVRVSLACDPADALWGLLHDASEAYVGDMVRPLKLLMPAYKTAEQRIQRVICDRFGLARDEPASVHRADSALLFTEARDLMGRPPNRWKQTVDPLPEVIFPWAWHEAEARFLDRFAELGGKP